MPAYTKMQSPADRSGDFHCNAIGQSGATYRNVVSGSIIDVDTRDAPLFLSLGFVYAAMAAPAIS